MAAIILPTGKQQYFDSNGDPLVGGKIYTYVGGSGYVTPKDTYTTAAASVANANPVILDSRGEATIFWNGAYDVVVKDSLDNTLYSVPNITTVVLTDDITYNSVTLSNILKNSTQTVVNSISALRSVDKTKYTKAFVTGYYSAGDGGGGSYWYDSADTTSSDDGGAIIVATDGGRWKLIVKNNTISVLQYGAKTDYSTDAGTAFANAVAFLETDGGVLTVDGNFYINATMTVPDGVRVQGYQDVENEHTQYGGYACSDFKSTIYCSQDIVVDGEINGVAIIYDALMDSGVGLPQADLTNYSATAVGVRGSTTGAVRNCFIFGFASGIGSSLTASPPIIEGNAIDCTAGIRTNTNGFESIQNNYIYNCGVPGVASRTGIGLYINTAANESCNPISGNYISGYTGGGMLIAQALGDLNGLNRLHNNHVTVASGANQPIKITPSASIWDITGNFIYNNASNNCLEMTDGTAAIYGNSFYNAAASYAINLSSANVDYTSVQNNWYATPDYALTGNATALLKCMRNKQLVAHKVTAFTPSLLIGGSATGITYGTQAGTYYVYDNVVHFSIHFILTSRGGGAAGDDATISGLPFTSTNEAGSYGGCNLIYSNNMSALSSSVTGLVAKNGTTITLYQETTTGSTALEKQDMTDTAEMVFTGFYFIDR